MEWLNRSEHLLLDLPVLYQEHKVCKSCYKLYTESEKLRELELIRDQCLVEIQKVLAKHNIGAGKTLNVSAGTLTLANNQISGDKIEGGTIAGITITALGSTTGNITTVNSTTVDTTNIEVTNIKAKDGTSAELECRTLR